MKRNRALLIVTIAAVIVLSGDLCRGDNILSNGDFEGGGFDGWSWTPTAFPEPFMTTEVVMFDVVGDEDSQAFRVNPGTDEDHRFTSNEGGTLSQTVFMLEGRDYDVSIDAAIRCMLPLPNAGGGKISLSVGSTPLWTWIVSDIDGSTTLRNSFQGVYTPLETGLYDVSITFLRHAGNFPTEDYPTPRIYHYIDNATVTPEPATMSLLTLGGVALLRRRRK